MARLMSFGDAPPPSSRAHDDSRSASDDHDDPEPSSEAPRAVKKRRKRRKALTTEEDVAILRAVAAVRPHHAAHGQGRRRWQEAADRVVAECGNELSATLCKGRFDNMLKRFVQEQETGGLWPRDATRRELVMAALEDQKALGDKVLRPENGASWKKRMLEMDLRRDDATAEPQDKPKDKAPLAKHKTTNASPMRTTTTNAAPTVANSATPTNANVNANANARATTTATSSSPAPMRASSTSQPLRTVLTPPRPGMGNVGRGAYIVANRMGGSPGKSRNGPPPHAHDRTRLTPPTRPSPTPERALPSLSVVPRPASASAAGPVSNKNAPGAKSAATTTTALAVPGRQSSTTTSSGLQKVARSQSTSSAVPANLLWPLYNPAPLANGGLPWNVVRANAINMINGSGQGPSAPPNGPPPQSGQPPPKTGPPPQGSGPPPPPGSAPPAPTGSDDRDRSRLPSVASVSQSAHQILAAARSEAPVPTILKSSVSRPPPSQAAPTSSSPRPPPSQPPSQPPPQPSPQQPTARSPARPPADSVHPVPADSMQRREEHIREPRQEQRPQGPAPEGHIVPLRPPSTTDSPNERRSFVESALFTMLDRFTEMERAWLRDRDQDRELRRRAAAANRSPRGDNGGYEPSDVSREEFDEVVLEMAASRRERAGLRQEIDSLTNALARSEYEQSMMREQMASLASLVRESRRENYELKQDVGSLASMLREVTGQSGALRELEAAQQRQAEELRRYQQDEESRRRIAQIDDRVRYETLEQRIEQLEHSGEAENEEPQGEPASGEEGAQDQTQTATSQQTRAENPRARTRTFHPFAELQATMEKQQELIKLYEQAQTMRDSHSRTEFEIAELKTAIDVERAERTREYMALLDNIKRVLAVDGGNEDRA